MKRTIKKGTKRTTKKRPEPEPEANHPHFAPVVDAFASDRLVSRGKMFGSVGLKVNGKVFAMVVKNKLVVKLPKERVGELVASGSGQYFDPGHGRLMKEWIAVAGAKAAWTELAREAHRYVKGGKP